MVVQFKCPEGHVISCPLQRVGRPAKCPKCGAKFKIPKPGDSGDELPQAEALTDDSAVHGELTTVKSSSSVKTTATAAQKATKQAAKQQEQIEFLCPNDHKLNGPARLAGQAGQCPHCGSKFRIPSLAELRGETVDETEFEEVDDEIPTGSVVDDEDDVEQFEVEAVEEIETFEPVEEFDDEQLEEFDDDDLLDDLPAVESLPAVAEDMHPLASIFNWMWDLRGDDTVVELSLGEGDLLTPQLYARELSQDRYAVFALRDSSGAHTLISVPWDSVTQVSIRKVPELPDGLFE